MEPAPELQALARAARAGNRGAFEELAVRIRDRVFWTARQIVGNAEDAKDVSQAVLVRLWQNLERYDDRYPFGPWVYRMTVNLAIDHVRQVSPRRWDSELDEGLVEAGPASAGAPEHEARRREVERIFAELRDLLPPQQRAAFALREIEGLTSEEVASILGLSPSTVRNHLLQARRTLQRELLARYPEYAPKPGQAGAPVRPPGSDRKEGPAS